MFRKSTYTSKSKTWKKRFWLALEIMLYLIGIALLIQIFFIPPSVNTTFDTEARKKLVITREHMLQNTTDYQNWVANTCDDLCGIQLFHYYIFNITNPSDVLDGAYPQLKELGPFVFNRYEIRKEVQFSNDGSIVSYKYEYKYILNEKLSNMSLWNYTSWHNYQLHSPTASPTAEPHNLEDISPYPPIYILNPFMLGAFAQCRMSNNGAGGGGVCNAVGSSGASKYFLNNETVQSILQTGMKSETTLLCNWNPLCNRTQKYMVDDDVYVSEYTGAGNMHDMRQLITFYGINQTFAGGISNADDEFHGWWAENEMFSGKREPKQWPYDTITSKSILSAHMMDKFRSVKLISNGTLNIQDLQVDKFIIDPKEYYSAENNSANAKYYQNNGTHDGMLNLTSTNGVNILQYSSKPFFLDAPYYISEINNKMGLRQPNRTIDDTYFAIDSKLGTVFKLQVAYQVSFGIFPCEKCGFENPFRNIQNLIVPQFYVRVNGGAPEAGIEQYKDVLALLDTTFQFSIYAAPTIAFICFVIALYLSGRRYCNWKRKHNLTLYMDDDDKDEWDYFQNFDLNDNAIDNAELYDGKEEHIDQEAWDESLGTGFAARDEPVQHLEHSMDKTIRDCDTLKFIQQHSVDSTGSTEAVSVKNDWKNTESNTSETPTSKLLKKVSASFSNSS